MWDTDLLGCKPSDILSAKVEQEQLTAIAFAIDG